MKKPKSDPSTAKASALAAELRTLIGTFKRRLRDQAHMGDLTWSQTSVLSRLDRDGPASVTALAQAEGMRPQSMGAIVSTLQAAGLVEGAPDPDDGRRTILSLSAASRDWIRASRAAKEDWLFRAIEANLAPAEQQELINAVALLKRIVES